MSGAQEKKTRASPRSSLARSALKAVAGLGAVAAVWLFLKRDGVSVKAEPRPVHLVNVKTFTSTHVDLCGQPTPDGRAVGVSILYSDPTQPWIEQAANRFAKLCPNIQIKLTLMPDVDAADAILKGELKPTIWSPTDNLVVNYLAARWKQQSSEALFNPEDKVSLVQSPLVLLIWLDRLSVLRATLHAERSDEGPWVRAWCTLIPREPDISRMALRDMVPGHWIDWYSPIAAAVPKKPPRRPSDKPAYEPPFPTTKEIGDWGRVKFIHTSPTRSAAGLEVVYLMAYDYALPPSKRGRPGDGKDLTKAFESAFSEKKGAFQRWMRRCEGGLDATPSTARALTEEMFSVGPSRYDAIATFEHLSFSVLERLANKDSVLRTMMVLYPHPTFINQYPAVILWPNDAGRATEREAARKWVAFLRSKEMQEKAIEHGFRPSVPEVSIRSYDVPGNAFLHLRRYGVVFDEPIVEPPRADGAVVQEIMAIWGDATGRN